ncbi:hypothetical protein ACBQ19_14375, partial [Hafnia alvei]
NPHDGIDEIRGGQVEATTDYCRDGEWPVQNGEVLVYAAPVLPKQPVKPVMFIDGDISSDDVEKLAAVIREFGNEPASAQPVIPERPELRYGDNVLWFLNELAAFDASDIDSDDFDVYGEGRNGMEGCATISITELAAVAAKLLSAQPVIPEQPVDQDLELYIDMLENSDSDDEDGELNNTQLIVWLKELQRRRALCAVRISMERRGNRAGTRYRPT